ARYSAATTACALAQPSEIAAEYRAIVRTPAPSAVDESLSKGCLRLPRGRLARYGSNIAREFFEHAPTGRWCNFLTFLASFVGEGHE
ncbi:MAG: hypothetical protein ABSE84_20650, partial [Isosphaeraceae bacterium]